VLDIYDSQLGMLRIGPFNYDPVRGVDLWLSQTDEFILQHLSTSPEVEPPHFVMQVRATLKYIQDNQFPGEIMERRGETEVKLNLTSCSNHSVSREQTAVLSEGRELGSVAARPLLIALKLPLR
jgi:Protein N-terminal asparagine amidohydrolase